MNRSESQWYAAGFTAQWWKTLSRIQRRIFLETLSDEEIESFYKDWRIWARDKQIFPDGDWGSLLLLAGRGFGKTRSCVEYVRDRIERGINGRVALVGQGEADIRTVMIDGPSGFIACAPSWCRPKYYPSVGMGELQWPNGAVAYVYSAEDPESLRGPEFDLGWFDEPMAVPPEKRAKTVYNLRFGLRLGKNPKLIYSTTPKPHRWLRELVAQESKLDKSGRRRLIVVRGSTLENRENLADSFFDGILDDYDGTTIGRQEIYAEILGEEAGAIWTGEMLDKQRMRCAETDDGSWPTQLLQNFAMTCDKVVVAVDPNVTASKTAHAAGIVVIGRRGVNRYLLADYSVKGQSPAKWAAQALKAYMDFNADEIVGEINQGGDMVKEVIKQAAAQATNRNGGLGVDFKFVAVRATKGKQRRAEPIASAYELGRIWHMGMVGTKDRPGAFYNLESQMTAIHEAYDPTGEDFDRADALVWGMTRLGAKKAIGASSSGVGIHTFADFIS